MATYMINLHKPNHNSHRARPDFAWSKVVVHLNCQQLKLEVVASVPMGVPTRVLVNPIPTRKVQHDTATKHCHRPLPAQQTQTIKHSLGLQA